jgi:hypothetical protein
MAVALGARQDLHAVHPEVVGSVERWFHLATVPIFSVRASILEVSQVLVSSGGSKHDVC